MVPRFTHKALQTLSHSPSQEHQEMRMGEDEASGHGTLPYSLSSLEYNDKGSFCPDVGWAAISGNTAPCSGLRTNLWSQEESAQNFGSFPPPPQSQTSSEKAQISGRWMLGNKGQ